jgi:phosphoribosyl-AMP cyclohydrolase
MLAYANREAVNMTLTTGLATFWSRSRKKLWVKGKTSGNFLKIVRVLADCDLDALLYVVRLPKNGGACHEKNKRGNYRKSCFFRRMAKKI